jgi:hypothetical protein
MTVLGAISAIRRRPDELIAAEVAMAVISKLPPERASALAGVDPLALEAYAGKRNQAGTRRAIDFVRNRAIWRLARHHGLSPTEIEREMARYEGNGWQRDRLVDDMPARYACRPQELLWLAFKCVPRPLKRRYITEVIEIVEYGWR